MLDEERTLLAKRWPEMAAKIQKRLLSEGKITKEMIESYVDAYAGIYGDDTDAYVEEIIADTYAGMNRTDYGTNQLRADVKMEVGQWQKKSGSARAPPVKTQYSIKKDNRGQNYVDVPIWAMQIKNASEVGKALSDIVRKQFRSWVDVAGQKIGINQRTAGEWTFSKDAQRLYSRNKTAYADKVNAFGVAGELLQASRDYIGEQAKHFRKDNFREFARGKVSFKVGANGYEADIIVGTTTKGAAILYDMVNITPKKIAEAPNTTLSAKNAEDRRQGTSTKNSVSETGETVKGKMSAQDGRYRDLMGEKAAQYTKGKLCAYRKIKKSLSKTGEGFLYRCTIIPITPFTKTMRSDKDTSGTPETIRTSDPSLRSMAYHVIHGSDVTSNIIPYAE